MMMTLSQSRHAGLLLQRLLLQQLLAWPRQAHLAAVLQLLPDPAAAAALAQHQLSAAAAPLQRGWLPWGQQQQQQLAAQALQLPALPALQQMGLSACVAMVMLAEHCHCCRQNLYKEAGLQQTG
jgi:hypothetical protein